MNYNDNWFIEEKDLLAANDDNTKINYNVDKVDLEGFKTTITKNNESSYTITNSKSSNDISTNLEVPSEAPDTSYKGLSDNLIYITCWNNYIVYFEIKKNEIKVLIDNK